MPQKDLFIAELIFTLTSQVTEDVDPSPIERVTTLPDSCHVSQLITGDFEAYTAIYGDIDALKGFASEYAHFEVDDECCDEILGDFLNLNNGRFTVSLSDTLSMECSLSVPGYDVWSQEVLNQDTYIFPVTFSYGTVYFVFSE